MDSMDRNEWKEEGQASPAKEEMAERPARRKRHQDEGDRQTAPSLDASRLRIPLFRRRTKDGDIGERPKKYRIRLIPIWLRILIVLVLMVVFFFIGAMIGYGVIGDGSPWDVFKKSTWTHITDIIYKGT